MTTWINPLRTAITASSDPQTFTPSVNSMETATMQPGPASSVVPQTLTTPINSVGPATTQPGYKEEPKRTLPLLNAHTSMPIPIIIKLTSAFCYHIYSIVWHTFLITVQKQRHPRDPGTVSKEQRPPQQGKGICFFCQTFLVTVFNSFYPFQRRQSRKRPAGFFRDDAPKRPDMGTIEASAYNCSCWRRVLQSWRCDFTARRSLQLTSSSS